jgi:hypothetical protein
VSGDDEATPRRRSIPATRVDSGDPADSDESEAQSEPTTSAASEPERVESDPAETDLAETAAIPTTHTSARTVPLPVSGPMSETRVLPETAALPETTALPETPVFPGTVAVQESTALPDSAPSPKTGPLPDTVPLPDTPLRPDHTPEPLRLRKASAVLAAEPGRAKLAADAELSGRPAARIVETPSTGVAPADRPPLAVLVPVEGDLLGQVYPLYEDQSSLGRSESNNVMLSSPQISRLHAKIVHLRGSFTLYPLSEDNPTFLGDKALARPAELGDGAVIRIGRTIFRFKTIEPW